ncbi:MAG: PAS domain-containing sensor histidine kinase [Mangrovibacterium sp.]
MPYVDYSLLSHDELLRIIHQKDESIDSLQKQITTIERNKRGIKLISQISDFYNLQLKPEGIDADQFFQAICDLVCQSSPIPEYTSCRIRVGNDFYASSNFEKGESVFRIGLGNNQIVFGNICVYLNQPKNSNKYSIDYLKSEMDFIQLAADKIGASIYLIELQGAFDSLVNQSSMPTCIIDLDDNFRFLQTNDVFLRRIQYKADDIIGKTPQEIGLIDDELYVTLQKVQKGEIKHMLESIKYNRKDDEVVQSIIIAQNIKLTGQKLAVCTFADFNDLSRFQKEMTSKNAILQNIMDNLEDTYIETDENFHTTFANQAATKLYGVKDIANLIGTNNYLLFSNETDVLQIIDNLNQQKKIDSSRIKFQRFNGSSGWMSIHGNGIYENDKLVGTRCIIRDVSAEVQAENELRDFNEKFNSILASLNDAYIQNDREGYITFVNQTFLELFGYDSAKEVLGKHVLLAYANPEERNRLIKSTADGNDIRDFTTSCRRKDGSTFWASFSGQYIRNKKGLITHRHVLVRDISERVCREQEIKEDNILLNDIFESINDGFFQTNQNNEIDFTNDKFVRMLGYASKEELLGLEIQNIYHDKNIREKIIQSSSNDKFIEDVIIQIKRKDGSLFWASISGRILKDEDGAIIYTRTAVRDISERMAQDNALQKSKMETEKSQLRFQSLSEQSSEGIVLINESGTFEFFNNAFCELHNMTAEEMRMAVTVAEINPVGEATEQIKLVRETKTSQYFERMPFLQKDGSTKYANIHGDYFELPHESLLLFTFTDITNEVRKQEELIEAKINLEKSRLRFQGLSEQSSEGIVLINEKGEFVFYNNAFCELHDVLADEIRDAKVKHNINPLGNAPQHVQTILETRKNSFFEKEPFLQKDGSIKYANIHGSFLELPHESLLLFTFTDITNEILKREELIETRQKAIDAERVKSAFLMNMSHEIRTPMNGILGFVDLLSMDDLTVEERQSYVEIINQSGNRLLSTINDIIEVSRIESGKLEPRYESINLSEFLSYHYNFFKPQVEAKSIDFIFQINAPCELEIMSDKKILDGICTNLIKNAIKFTECGSISFSCTVEDTCYKIQVSDSGQGINTKRQKEIFEQFSQADKDYLNRKHEGSGLGLTITEAYVDSLGGKITLSSELNVGSTFTVCLPLIKS